MNQPTPLLWSITKLPRENRNKNSPGFKNLIFQHDNDEDLGNLSNWGSDIWSLCFTGIEFCGTSAGKKDRHWCCAPNSFFTSRDKSPCTYLHWNRTCGTWCRRVKNFLIKRLWWIDNCTWIAKKRFPVIPDKFHVSGRMLRSRLNRDRGLGTTAGWLGTWDSFPLQIDSISWKSPEIVCRGLA